MNPSGFPGRRSIHKSVCCFFLFLLSMSTYVQSHAQGSKDDLVGKYLQLGKDVTRNSGAWLERANGDDLSEEDIDEMITDVDSDGSPPITAEEFRRIMSEE